MKSRDRVAGQGYKHRNKGSGGRGNSGNRRNDQFRKNINREMKFYMQSNSKGMCYTFETVKDYIIEKIQKNFDKPSDIVVTLRDLMKMDLEKNKPIREKSTIVDEEEREFKQQSNDMEYKLNFSKWRDRSLLYPDNLKKAYAVIMGYCSLSIRERIESDPDFETVIRDDPVELLGKIKLAMQSPMRARYPYSTATETLKRMMELKQEDNETLVDYTKRFK